MGNAGRTVGFFISIQMQKDLLIIIDPQNDFTNTGGYYARHHPILQITDAKQKINQLLTIWHPQDVIIISSDYQYEQFKKDIGFGIPQTFGHQLDSDFKFSTHSHYITKTEHSAFSNKSFLPFLTNLQPNNIFLCGFLAEYCVLQTATDLIQHGFTTHLIEDCIGTGDDVQDRKINSLNVLDIKNCINIKSTNIIQQYKK